MKRNSIVFKLFIVTTLFFSIIVGLIVVSQTLFFDTFYMKKKKSEIAKEVELFSENYLKDPTLLDQIANEYYEKNNAFISVLNVDQQSNSGSMGFTMVEVPDPPVIFENGLQLSLLSTDGKLFTVSLTEFFLNGEIDIKNLNTIGIFEGNYMEVIGTREDGKVTPVYIRTTNKKLSSYKLNNNEKYGIIRGTINKIDINIGEETKLKWDLYMRAFQEYRKNYTPLTFSTDETVSMSYYDSNSGTDNLISVQPIFENNSATKYIFTMHSLQPVNEAVDVMKDYYIYAAFVFLILIFMMSMYYSRIISKPLIKINKVATKMSNLNFTEELKIKSDDEIGSLSRSINKLSSKLHETITNLQMANQKLQEDIERERKLEKMRKEFVSGISHELKTPLSIIQSYAEGIKDGVSIDKSDYYTDIIIQESNKMNGLISDMLELSRLESGFYHLNIEKFSMSDLVNEIQNKLQLNIGDKKLEMINNIELDCVVYADRKKMEQVISNFYSNAIRYTPEGLQIHVHLKKEKGHVLFSIENQGVTLPEDEINKIWDRFYRIEGSRNKETGGTGLGLSIVKNILELHHAQFGVQNTEKGVSFYFIIKEKEFTEAT
ncbi:sensor histidine kinase [Chengkuizengella axinellae]|uniref:histidine kinase n=1 Tax=Chengkuizengella axinellae TaxID=3064388 RepID=A0ABT9J1V8_9BACL|nr:HAMP domain-containing sensor histidine kinase [Chengkuizengella sp. 2205SS18-9]MDP5275591.1 HAMP domain-containing sensor histidine kinase [Chengkuizengella sp. 2205SS18-9]